MKYLCWIVACLCAVFGFCHSRHHEVARNNVLFIMFDDLRPDLECYGRKHMITPNFDRLAKRSVVFDQAYCQIAVCNPSRDSLLTGLRPDTTGTYGFQSSFRPHMVLPALLSNAGYRTAGYGKIFHWETDDKGIWNHDHYDGNWYGYQQKELKFMNSSTMPDRITPEEEFRDYIFTSKAIDALRELSRGPANYMVALGFKLPHLAVHVPYKYYDMYRDRSHLWKTSSRALRFPPSAPLVAYKCCAIPTFSYMHLEGSAPAVKRVDIGRFVDEPTPPKMYDELMIGYAAAITFLDAQIGRLLDVIDELELWSNLTVVLTSDHGMHNGEKGIWYVVITLRNFNSCREKWTLFDESLRVPLFISHPASPYANTHYSYPVELIDIFPTLLDLLHVSHKLACKPVADMNECHPLQGKSLAKIIMGPSFESSFRTRPKTLDMLAADDNFAISQSWRCAPKDKLLEQMNATHRHFANAWFECNKAETPERKLQQVSVLGYTLRTVNYRYTAWYHYDRETAMPLLEMPPFAEEFYNHIDEELEDFGHQELGNYVHKLDFQPALLRYRSKLLHFIRKEIDFRGPFVG